MPANPQLICPEWIATVEPGQPVLTNHGIVIENDKIAQIGPVSELIDQYPDSARLDLPNQLVCPGFVNAHTHLAMTLMRGFADDLPLHEWLNNRIWPAEGKWVSPDFVYEGSLLAGYEMVMGGTTCFSDMYFFPEQVAQAANVLGLRAMLGMILIDFPSAYAGGPDEYIRKGIALRDANRENPLLSFCLAPHAPYTVSDESFAKIVTLASELQLPIHIHLHETAFEVEQALKDNGQRPMSRMAELGVVGPNLIAVHAVHLDTSEIELLARNGASVVHCPHSNLKLGSGIAPVAEMLAAGVNLAIGTDGSASNNRLDLLQEVRTAALLAKGASKDAGCFNAIQALEALTLGGAKALGLQDKIGSIHVGKQADLVAVDLSAPEMQPVFDPISQLIYTADRRCVSHVWIAGRAVVSKQRLVNLPAQQAVTTVVEHIDVWQNRLSELLH